MTLYLGAGGGGDTNSAVFRALADVNAGQNVGSKYVLGAGYAKKAYYDQLKKNAPSIFTDDTIVTTYFDSVATKVEFSSIPINDTEIYKLKGEQIPLREQYINAIGTVPYKSWTYNTLFDESQLLINMNTALAQANLLDNIYMSYSVKSFEKEDVIKMYKGLREFIKLNSINNIYLMDFGADIFDFKELARDTAMLLAIVRLIQKEFPNIKLIVEVYGPGVDAHDTYTKVMENLDKIQPIKEVLNKDALDKYMDLLDTNRKFNMNGKDVKLEIMEAGRATGNYYEAWRLCEEELKNKRQRLVGGKNKKKLKGGEYNDYVKNYIGKRYDLTTLSNGAIKDILDIANTTEICKFAEAYIYNIDTPEKMTAFVNSLNELPIARISLETLDKKLTEIQTTIGGKNKSQNYKKTTDKIKVGKREAVIYKGQRGGKYIKQKGLYINIKKLKIV